MTPDHIRCLRMIALTNEERMKLFAKLPLPPEGEWFLKNIDELAPELKQLGWVEERPFDHVRGAVVVTKGEGDVRMVVATELGRQQLNAAVVLS